jgi:type III pantothenate kinase
MTTLLAVDVGNTNVVLGAYRDAKLVATWRTATVHDRTEDELAVTVDALLGRQDLSLGDTDHVGCGDV